MDGEDVHWFMYRDAANTIATLDQRMAAFRDLITAWRLTAEQLVEHPEHIRRCTAEIDEYVNNMKCGRCIALQMYSEVKEITSAIL
jgi:hypothetical protein